MTENEEFEFRARRERELAKAKQSENEEPGVGKKAGAFAYGATTGLLGGLGELEKFGAYTAPQYLGLQEKGQPEPTLFPTTQDVQGYLGKVGIQKPDENVSGYRDVGEIVGGFGTSLPSALRGTAKSLVGLSSKVGEESAQALEKLGFKLSPAQVRRFEPTGQKGATSFAEHNQDLANKLATEGTGESTKSIYPGFIGGRLRDLGEDFNSLYRGKVFNIDQKAVDAISRISQEEAAQVGNTGVSAVKKAADDIIQGFDSLASRAGAKPNTFGIQGEALQRLRNALTQTARSTNRVNAHEIYNLVDEIDASIARNHKDVAKTLDELRPKYRNAVILEDLQKQGGIHNGDISLDRLGRMLEKQGSERVKHPRDIDALAQHAKNTQLRGIFEPSGTTATETGKALEQGLGSKLGLIPKALGTQRRAARSVQKFYSTPSGGAAEGFLKGEGVPGATATSAGTASRFANEGNNE